ncbi:MAG: MFS transporter [Pseudolabrys sp.]
MQSNLRPIASLLLAIAFLMAGNGLQFTLVPLRGHVMGFSSIGLGVIGSAYYVGFVSGCLLGPYLIVRAGHIRAFAALTALAVVAALAYTLNAGVAPWTVFRILNGFCLAGIYLVIESWLNDRATNTHRGLVMSAYVFVNFLAFTAGQFMVTLYPIREDGNFIVAAMLASMAIVPVALTRSAQPAPITIVTFRPLHLYRAAPVGLVASLVVGAANGAFLTLGPLSAVRSGLNVGYVALFMGAATAGGALAQWPAGRLSDRLDRRMVLLALLVGASLTGFALWLFAATDTLLLVFGALFGALALPCYALAAAHAFDKTPISETVPTAATILLANALGSVIGPMLASVMMALQGPRALFLFTAATQALLVAFVVYRTTVQEAVLEPDKTSFDFAATAPVGAMVTGEQLDPMDPSVAVPEPYGPPPGDGPAASS